MEGTSEVALMSDPSGGDLEPEAPAGGNGAGGNGMGTASEPDDQVGNRVVGAMAVAVLEHIARSITRHPDGVVVETVEGRGSVRLRLHVDPSDMGRVIGRQGRVAQAIRAVVRVAGARDGVDAIVDIVDA